MKKFLLILKNGHEHILEANNILDALHEIGDGCSFDYNYIKSISEITDKTLYYLK